MDLYFTRATAGANGGATQGTGWKGSVSPAGAQQISHAVAAGGVTGRQGERRATADHGEYTAADGKFVMSGGTPTIFYAASGTTTGRQFNFFLADATILVYSNNPSPTPTRPPPP